MQLRGLFIGTVLAGVTFALPAFAVTSEEFVQKASVSSKFEIDSSQLALAKSQDKDVKAFAQQMIDDHTKASDNLKSALKATKGDIRPSNTLDEKHQGLLNELKNENGKDFDDEYVSIQKDAHEEAVDLFSDYAKNGDDASLKNFASKTLPTLKQHLEHVQKLNP